MGSIQLFHSITVSVSKATNLRRPLSKGRVGTCLNLDVEAPNPLKSKSNRSKVVVEEEGEFSLEPMQELRWYFPVARAVNCTIPKGDSFLIVQLRLPSMRLVMVILIGSGPLQGKLMCLLMLVMPITQFLRWSLRNVWWLIRLWIVCSPRTLEQKQMMLLLSFPGSFKDLIIPIMNSLQRISSPLLIVSMVG